MTIGRVFGGIRFSFPSYILNILVFAPQDRLKRPEGVRTMFFDELRRRLVPLTLGTAFWLSQAFATPLSAEGFGSKSARKTKQEPAVLRFSASELDRLEQGVHPAEVGTLAVWIWGSPRERWSLESPQGGVWSLRRKSEGADGPPVWRTAGFIKVESLVAPIRFSFDRGTREAPRPVPALLWLVPGTSRSPSPRALDLARGRIDSAACNLDPRRSIVRTNREGVDFRAPSTSQEWNARAERLRDQLRVSLGLLPEWPRTPLHPIVRPKVEREGYSTENVALETLPGFYLCGTLYRPLKARGKSPGLLCPHGHWPEGRTVADVQKRCSRWAQLGCVVFAYDMVGYQDGEAFGHAFLNDRLRRRGLSLPSLQTWNGLRALDWLSALPDVDAARIGMTGESGGGTQTFLLTALDDRIRVSAPAVMVSEGFQGGCVCENAAGLRIGTDNVEIAALCAPRPLMMVGATGDWTAHTMTRAFPAVRDVYRLIGDPADVHAEVFEFPHNYNQTSREAVYAWMSPRLLGQVDPKNFAEPPQKIATAAELRVFDRQRPAPEARKNAAELETDLIAIQNQRLDELSPPKTPNRPWDAGREELKRIHRVRIGVENPLPKDLAERKLRSIDRDDETLGRWTVRHYRVGRARRVEEIPVAVLDRPSVGCKADSPITRAFRAAAVIVDSQGKGGLADEEGEPTPLVVELLKRGWIVVGFDPFGIGEAFDPASPFASPPPTVHFDTYNPVPTMDRMQDLATVVAWTKSRLRAAEVNVVGLGSIGPLVLAARPAIEGIDRAAVDLQGFDLDDKIGTAHDSIDLPGILQFGGLANAAALASPKPLMVFRCEFGDSNAPARAYAGLGAGTALRLEQSRPSDETLARWIANDD